jgi:hypothetical protein
MAVLTTTTQKRNAWLPWLDHCSGRNGAWANPTFFGKVVGGVPEPWADPLLALELTLRATGYTPASAWAYNFRGISGKTCTCASYGNCSLHGQGIAIDIDPKLNPYIATTTFSWSKTAFTATQISAVEGIRNTKGEQIWFWGGRWGSIKDYMHFEANVDPGSTKVDWSTVPGSRTGGDDDMLLKSGDKGQAVAEVQKIMAEKFAQSNGTWSPYAVNGVVQKSAFDGQPFGAGEDGDFGGTCETNVKTTQKALGQIQTGQVDQLLWDALVHHRYGAAGGLSGAQVDAKIAAHTKIGVAHGHRHAEGTTGPPTV